MGDEGRTVDGSVNLVGDGPTEGKEAQTSYSLVNIFPEYQNNSRSAGHCTLLILAPDKQSAMSFYTLRLCKE